jgi:hypothetical protein
MKNQIKSILLMGIAAVMFFASCGKYEDGPNFSLRSKKARLVNTWVIDKAYENGEDFTEEFKQDNPNYQLEIRKDQSMTVSIFNDMTGETEESKGKWEFSKDKEEVKFTDDATGNEISEKILRLTNNEFWAELDFGIAKLEIHYKSK